MFLRIIIKMCRENKRIIINCDQFGVFVLLGYFVLFCLGLFFIRLSLK